MSSESFPHLFNPITLAGLTLKNRIFSAPASMCDLDPFEHYTRENYEFYKTRAAGGAALVTVGDVIVDLDTGRSHPLQASINAPGSELYFVRMADAIHSKGAAASIEIDHGGALCAPQFIGGKHALGPSAGYIESRGATVDELTEEQMDRLASAFATAAKRAKEFGFDMVMLHSGHGWLLHQFISPVTNRRTDQWGGSFEKRMRFPLMVLERIRSAVGRNFPIEVRISGAERMPGGYDIETGVKIAQAYDGKVELIHVSAGTQMDSYANILMHPGAFQHDMENAGLAAEIKKYVKTPVVSVGAFNMPDDMERFLAEGHADAIALGRALVADPFLPRKLAAGKPQDIRPCLRCGECHSGMRATGALRCSVNPLIGREIEYTRPIPVTDKKRVLIAGGGPGGMQAALTAVSRGHEVLLCETGPKLGGALRFADSGADFKAPIKRYRDSQIRKVMESPVRVMLNTRVDKSVVDEFKPDALIAAVGGVPVVPPIEGIHGDNVFIGADLMPDTPVGHKVVVIGGGFIGCEEAIQLARTGREVTILEMLPQLATECGFMHKCNLDHFLDCTPGITALTEVRCTKITENAVCAQDKDGKEIVLPCDSVVLATGMRAVSEEVEALRPLVNEFYVIGSAIKARTIMYAVRDGYDAAVNLGTEIYDG